MSESPFTQNHPDYFDIRLFKATTDLPERELVFFPSISFEGGRPVFRVAIATADEIMGIEAPAMEWADSVIVKAVKVSDGPRIAIGDSGDNPVGDLEQPMTLLIDAGDIPPWSFLEIDDYVSFEHVYVATFIITEIKQIGEAPGAGNIYTCIPAHKIEDFIFIEPPKNNDPYDGESEVYDFPTLTVSSPFAVHGRDDVHIFSQWQVWKEGQSASPIFDSGRTTEYLQHCPIPEGILEPGKTYFWHVRYGASGEDPAISEFSEQTSFTTAVSFEP